MKKRAGNTRDAFISTILFPCFAAGIKGCMVRELNPFNFTKNLLPQYVRHQLYIVKTLISVYMA